MPVARALAAAGVKVGLAAREVRKLSALATEIGAETFNADATNLMDVVTLFDEMEGRLGPWKLCSIMPQPGRLARSRILIQEKSSASSLRPPIQPSL